MRKFLSGMLWLCIVLLLTCSSCKRSSSDDAGETTSPVNEANVKIEVVKYPDPNTVSEYGKLTDSQKAAYNALNSAIDDIITSGTTPNKSYTLSSRVSLSDYETAYSLYSADFTAVESILAELVHKDSQNSPDYIDTVMQPDKNSYFDKAYKDYCTASNLADKILTSLEYDNTEYGKAAAIAEWMTHKINCHSSDDDYTAEDTVFGVLTQNRASYKGLAKSYDFLCKKAGLETIYVEDNELSIPRAWNMIRIDEKWYHIDVKNMNDDFYKYFMMPDSLLSLLFDETAEANEYVAPVADSYDLYRYYFKSFQDMTDYFKSSVKIDENEHYFAVIPNEAGERLYNLNGIIKSELDGCLYYISIYAQSEATYDIIFTKSIAITETEDGMHTIEHKIKNVVYDLDSAPFKGSSETVITLTMDIPNYVVKENESDDCNTYVKFNESYFDYEPVFAFDECFMVDPDFILDETFCQTLKESWIWNFGDFSSSEHGTTAGGYDYVLYLNKYSDTEYSGCIFIRISDEYIVSLYSDNYFTSDLMPKTKYLDTLKVGYYRSADVIIHS